MYIHSHIECRTLPFGGLGAPRSLLPVLFGAVCCLELHPTCQRPQLTTSAKVLGRASEPAKRALLPDQIPTDGSPDRRSSCVLQAADAVREDENVAEGLRPSAAKTKPSGALGMQPLAAAAATWPSCWWLGAGALLDAAADYAGLRPA